MSHGVIDYLASEAHDYLERLDAWLAAAVRARAARAAAPVPGAARPGADAPDAAALARDARALRGAATMTRRDDFAALGAAIERAAGALRDGRLVLDAAVVDALAGAVDTGKQLVRALGGWTGADVARARAHVAELDALLDGRRPAAAAEAPVVPIAHLAPQDGRPQLVHRAAHPPQTADQRFRRVVGPVAATLRRLCHEARTAVVAADAGALAGLRPTLGADLSAALRDLRDLAESYAVEPVVRLAAARESALAALDPHTIAVIGEAADALVTASQTARRTPPAGIGAVGTPAAAPTPAAPARAVVATPAAPVPAVHHPATPAAPLAPAMADVRSASPAVVAPLTAPVATIPVAIAASVAVPSPALVADAAPAAALAPPADVTPPVLPAAAPVAPSPAVPTPTTPATPATGRALVDLIETGLAGFGAVGVLADAIPLAGDAEAASEALAPTSHEEGPSGIPIAVDGVVPIDQLLYRGRAALDRARAVRDALRATPHAPDPALLAELYDLLDLAAVPD